MNTSKRINKIELLLLAMMLLATSFGESIRIFNINISWVIAFLLLFVTAFDLALINPGRFFCPSAKHKKIFAFALIWLFYGALQMFWAKDMALWKQGFASLAVNVFLIVEICLLFQEKESFKGFAKYAFLLWGVNIGLAFYEIITQNHFITDGVLYWDLQLVRTFFGNPNDSATWIVLSFLLALLFLKREQHKHTNLIEILMWAITLYAVICTGSRACMYGMIAYILFRLLAVLWLKLEAKASGNSALKIPFWIVVGAIAVIGILAIYSNAMTSLIEKISQGGNKESDLLRLDIIKDSIKVIFDTCFLGAGANQTIAYIGINPHNFFLELFSDYGIIVFAFSCYFFAVIINACFNKKELKPLRIYFLVFALVFVIISISSSSMNRLRLTWPVFTLVYLSTQKYKSGAVK